MKYRPEIDGLRAIAVLPVILFHAGIELFSGGFVGVDVFFVISGYLITTILIEDIQNNQFSLVKFYERRVRRILPALFVVMLVCIPFAWLWMIPSQMKDFSQSLVAVSLFASNILFWIESGYFDAVAEEKPLLHTWSLAVEEQYYLLFPIFLILTWRFGRDKVFWMIVIMAAISLLLSEWGWRNKPVANFYLAPTRAWELFSGSIAAFIVQKNGVQKNNTLALLGLMAIMFSIFAYDEHTPFPSIYALVPVIGVMLLVLYAHKETFVARLLSTKILVGIGLISYSAYLWHQPLFAFLRIRSALEPEIITLLLASGLSMALAFLSWKFIENPFRNPKRFGRLTIFVIATIGLCVFIMMGLFGHYTNGFIQRNGMNIFYDLTYKENSLLYAECKNSLDKETPKLKYCLQPKNSNAVILGDSHADDKFDGIAKNLQSYDWMLLGNPSCPPLKEVKFVAADKIECTERIRKALFFIESQSSIETVVLSFAHMYPLEKLIAADHIKRALKASSTVIEDLHNNDATPINAFYNGIERTVISFLKKSIDVIIVIDIPELQFMPEDCLRGKVSCEFNREDVIIRQEVHRKKINDIQKDHPQVRLFDPLDIFCNYDENTCTIINNGRTLYRDSHHLSNYGSRVYGAAFADWFESIER